MIPAGVARPILASPPLLTKATVAISRARVGIVIDQEMSTAATREIRVTRVAINGTVTLSRVIRETRVARKLVRVTRASARILKNRARKWKNSVVCLEHKMKSQLHFIL